MDTGTPLAQVDHLVYAVPELERGIADLEQLLGVRAARGGRHPTWGTCNALLGLGRRAYLEIIAPDPELPAPAAGRPFGLDTGGTPGLVAWAAAGGGLDALCTRAASQGVALGAVQPGSRRAPDGTLLEWRLTDLRHALLDGVVPFFIDWGTTPHPALIAPVGATLTALRIEHPDPGRVRATLGVLLGIDLPVSAGRTAALISEIDCPRGRTTLR